MEVAKDWIGGICAVAVIVSVIKAISPQNPAGKCVQLVGALVLILTVISPFKSLSISDVYINDRRYEFGFEEQSMALKEVNGNIQKEIIEDEIAAYISQRLLDSGVSGSDVTVGIAKGQKGDFYPDKVKIMTDENVSKSERREIEDIIKRECGVLKDRIVFGVKGGL